MKDLILLHGALGADTLFKPLLKLLPGNYKTHTFNLSGHGRAAFSNNGFGIEVFAEELAYFIQINKLIKPIIFGYSMGGYVALYLELNKPGSFEQIITLGTKFGWSPEAAQKETSRMKPEIIEQKVPAFAEKLSQRHGEQWKDLLKATANMMQDLGSNPLLNETTLPNITVPTTIMRGDQDQMVSREESEKAASQLPYGTYIELSNTPHPIEKVDPGLLVRQIETCQ